MRELFEWLLAIAAVVAIVGILVWFADKQEKERCAKLVNVAHTAQDTILVYQAAPRCLYE